MSADVVSLPAELIEDFEFLDDWSARYAYLIELGEKLPRMEEQHRTEDNRVKGCMSQVWVEAMARSDGHVDFVGDCDTAIIKGILAVLIELMSGLTPREIEALDLESLFDALQLRENLSPSRHFGVFAIVELMKQKAHALQPAGASTCS